VKIEKRKEKKAIKRGVNAALTTTGVMERRRTDLKYFELTISSWVMINFGYLLHLLRMTLASSERKHDLRSK
jgi:hypothetical protein